MGLKLAYSKMRVGRSKMKDGLPWRLRSKSSSMVCYWS